MKNAKIMLTVIAALAIVSGVLAMKVRNQIYVYQPTTINGVKTCPLYTGDYWIAKNGPVVLYVYTTAVFQGPAVDVSWCTVDIGVIPALYSRNN